MSIVTIYKGKSTPAELLTNGIGAIEATMCNPYEELNGEFSCTVSIPVGSKHSDAFVYGAIIKCSTPRGTDLFRLEQPTITLTDMTAKAWQISNDLGFPKVLNIYMSAKTGQQALTEILTSSADEQRFTGVSDVTTINNMRLELASPQAALMNTENPCFLNLWGGELYRNNFVVNVMNRIGSDKGYKIALGKNLTGVTETPSGTGYTNRIIPKCTYAAMDQSELAAAKAAIDAGTTANNDKADDERTAAKASYDTQYDLELVNAAAKRDEIYVAWDAQFLIDGNAEARDSAKAWALAQYNQTATDAAFNRDRDKAAADALCVSKKTQAGLYADQSKAVAEKRFSDLVDARKADIFLPEIYIDSPLANEHDDLRHTKFVSCDTIKVGEKNTDTGVVTYPDEQSAYTAMRAVVADLYAKGADVPGVTIDITFVDLKNTEEYKQFLKLNTLDLQLGDTVHCKYQNRDIEKRVSAYVWNSLSDRYESITIGDIAQNIAKSLYASDVSLDALKNDMTATLKQGEKYNKVYINHKDGFVAEATVGENDIKTVMNASEGISIYKGSSKIFYIDSTTGNIIMTGAATKEDMEEFNNLITALDAAAVKQGISYAGVAISPLSGVTSLATIGEHEVVVNMSAAAGGLGITSDGVDVGGLFLVGGVPALVAGVVANSRDPNVWAEIGEKIVDGNALKGLLMYRLDSLGAKYAASGWTLDADNGFAFGDSTFERVFAHSNKTGMAFPNGNPLLLGDENGVPHLFNSGGEEISLGGGGSALSAYPVGSVYVTYASATPDQSFGGVWLLISQVLPGQNVKDLFHFDGADDSAVFTDEMGGFATKGGTPVIKTAIKKFGSGSAFFAGNASYLIPPSPGTKYIASKSFTLSFWFYTLTEGRADCLLTYGGTNGCFGLYHNTDNKVFIWRGGYELSTNGFARNAWHHVAMVGADGQTVKVYIDGNLEITSGAYNWSAQFFIGANESSLGECLNGYIDDFMFELDNQRWTTNFTPPASAFAITADIVSTYRRTS